MIDGAPTPSLARGGRQHPLGRRLAKRLFQIVRDSYRYAAFPFRFSDSRGVFDSFEKAMAAAPRGKSIGYDDPALAAEYVDNLSLELADCDYPFLFHLYKILREHGQAWTVLDFGGNVGVHFLRYRQHLDLERVSWIVCDVPSIADRGREVCKEHANVRFISDVEELRDQTIDIVVAFGSVQYIENFAELLNVKRIRPRHILIGQVLLHDGCQFVTLQNGGRVYYPQYIFNKSQFVGTFATWGYVLANIWNDTSNGCVIPFHTELNVASTGLYFRLR